MDFNTISLLIFGLTILIIGGNLLLKAAVSISMKFGIQLFY
jgi:Ca2+/Na+ antiporter